MDSNTVQVVAYIASGATIGSALSVPILKYLARNWLKQREVFEQDTVSKIGLLHASIAATDKQLTAAIAAARDEAKEARLTLRAHVDHEDSMIRERSHKLANEIGVLSNKAEVVSLDIRAAIAANKETLTWCQEKYGALLDEIHRLAVDIAGDGKK